MVVLVSPKARIPNGTQVTDGRLCRPAITEPNDTRSRRTRAIVNPSRVPKTSDTAYPTAARLRLIAPARPERVAPLPLFAKVAGNISRRGQHVAGLELKEPRRLPYQDDHRHSCQLWQHRAGQALQGEAALAPGQLEGVKPLL